jgi:RNA polymerase sigma-70 factor, ECF subfamily
MADLDSCRLGPLQVIDRAGRCHHTDMLFSAPPGDTFTSAQAGDPAALDTVVRACAPQVLRWCRRLGGPLVQADDAAQDVLVVVFRRLRRVHGAHAFAPWVFGVTRRVLADHRRRAWMSRWLPGQREERGDLAGPDRRVELSEAARAIQAALERMPAGQREAFVLCVVEEHTDEEAAKLAGVPPGTLKSRLRLARARLALPDPPGVPAMVAPRAPEKT